MKFQTPRSRFGLGRARQVASVAMRVRAPASSSISICARTMGVFGLSAAAKCGKMDHETPSQIPIALAPSRRSGAIS